MGGAFLKGVNRDTQKFAMKASAVLRNGVWEGISKDPITDPDKRSKGRLALVGHGPVFLTVPVEGHDYENLLESVWRAGRLLRDVADAEPDQWVVRLGCASKQVRERFLNRWE
jgi:nicotinamide phosphoribosyltransferase